MYKQNFYFLSSVKFWQKLLIIKSHLILVKILYEKEKHIIINKHVKKLLKLDNILKTLKNPLIFVFLENQVETKTIVSLEQKMFQSRVIQQFNEKLHQTLDSLHCVLKALKSQKKLTSLAM